MLGTLPENTILIGAFITTCFEFSTHEHSGTNKKYFTRRINGTTTAQPLRFLRGKMYGFFLDR